MEHKRLAVAQAGRIGGGHGDGVVTGIGETGIRLQRAAAAAVVDEADEGRRRDGQDEAVAGIRIRGRKGQGQSATLRQCLIADGIQRWRPVHVPNLQGKAAGVREAVGVGDSDGDGIRASRREAGRKGERSAAVAVVRQAGEGRSRQRQGEAVADIGVGGRQGHELRPALVHDQVGQGIEHRGMIGIGRTGEKDPAVVGRHGRPRTGAAHPRRPADDGGPVAGVRLEEELAVGVRRIQAQAQHGDGGAASRRVLHRQVDGNVPQRIAAGIQFLQIEGPRLLQIGGHHLQALAGIQGIDGRRHHVTPGVGAQARGIHRRGEHGHHRGGDGDVHLVGRRVHRQYRGWPVRRQGLEAGRVAAEDVACRAIGTGIHREGDGLGGDGLAGDDLAFHQGLHAEAGAHRLAGLDVPEGAVLAGRGDGQAVHVHQPRIATHEQLQAGVQRRPRRGIGDLHHQVIDLVGDDVGRPHAAGMAHHHVEAGRPQHLHRGARRAAHRHRRRQAAAGDGAAEVDVQAVGADAVSPHDELAAGHAARADVAQGHAVHTVDQADIGDIRPQAGPHWRQPGGHAHAGVHAGQGEGAGAVAQQQGDLEELFQGLDAAVDDDDARDGVALGIGDHHQLGAAGDAAARRPAGAAASSATATTAASAATDPGAAEAIADTAGARLVHHRLADGDRRAANGQHHGEHGDVEIGGIRGIDHALVHQIVDLTLTQRPRIDVGKHDLAGIEMDDLHRRRAGHRLGRRRQVVDGRGDQGVLLVVPQGHVQAEGRGARIQCRGNHPGAATDAYRGVLPRTAAHLHAVLGGDHGQGIQYRRRQRRGVLHRRRARHGGQVRAVPGEGHLHGNHPIGQATGIDAVEGHGPRPVGGGIDCAGGPHTALIHQRHHEGVGAAGPGAKAHLAAHTCTGGCRDHIEATGRPDPRPQHRVILQIGSRRAHLAHQGHGAHRLDGIVTVDTQGAQRRGARGRTQRRCEAHHQVTCLTGLQVEGQGFAQRRCRAEQAVVHTQGAHAQRTGAGIGDGEHLVDGAAFLHRAEIDPGEGLDPAGLHRRHAAAGHRHRHGGTGIAQQRDGAGEIALGAGGETHRHRVRGGAGRHLEAGGREHAEGRTAGLHVAHREGGAAGVAHRQGQAGAGAHQHLAEIEARRRHRQHRQRRVVDRQGKGLRPGEARTVGDGHRHTRVDPRIAEARRDKQLPRTIAIVRQADEGRPGKGQNQGIATIRVGRQERDCDGSPLVQRLIPQRRQAGRPRHIVHRQGEGLAVTQATQVGHGDGNGIVTGIGKARGGNEFACTVTIVRQAGEGRPCHGIDQHIGGVGIRGRQGDDQGSVFVQAGVGQGSQHWWMVGGCERGNRDIVDIPTCAFIIGTAATRPGGNVEKSHPNRLAGIGSHVHVTLRPARGIGRHSTQVGPVAPRAADRVPHRNMHLAPVTAGVGKPLLEAQVDFFGA